MYDAPASCPNCRAPLPPRATAGLCPRCVFAALAEEAEESAPARLGEYDLLEPLGHGGMGTVWRARQRSAKRDVALKTLIAAGAGSAERRFRAEIEAAARLDHPNIVPVYEVGEADGRLWFTMRLLAGGSLASRGPLDARAAAALVEKLARAIAYAHERGVLHRDLKPANVLLDEAGEPHVADFGLARLLDSDASLSVSGQIVGTPQYMAPEQAAGGAQVTTATDVHGLGAILYELLAGRAPFAGKSTVEVLRRVVEDEPRAFGENPKSDLEIICLKCLAKDPARRYAGAAALAEDLGRWLRGEPVHARPATPIERLRSWARRHRTLAALLVAAAAGVLSFGAIEWRHQRALRGERDAARTQRDAAQAERARAERSEASLAENLHAADMQLAWQAYAMRDLGEARRVLERAGGRATFEARLLARLCEGGQERIFENLGPAPAALAWFGKNGALRVAGAGWMLDLDTAAGGTQPVKLNTHPLFDERLARPAAARLFPIEPWPAGFGEEPQPGAWMSRVNPAARGHPAMLAVSADGGRVALSARDRWSRVWDARTGEWLGAVPGTHGTVSMDAAGRLLAVGARRHTDADRGSAVIDLETRRDPWLLPEAGGAAAISRDGSRLFTGTFQGRVRAWDVVARRELRQWAVPHWISALAISADGRRAAYALAFDRTIGVLDVESGAVLRELRGHTGRIHALAFSPDGARLASAAADQTARLWSVAPGGVDHELRGHAADVTGVAFSPDGAKVATASPDGSVRLWSAAGPRSVPQVAVPEPEVYRGLLFIQPQGKFVASARWDGAVKIVDFQSGAARTLPDVSGSAEGWDGDALVVATAQHDALEWRDTGGSLRRRVVLAGATGQPLARRLGAGGRLLACACADRALRVWETAGGSVVREFGPLTGSSVVVAISRDGRAVVAAGYDGRTAAYDIASGGTLWTTPENAPSRFVDVSPDGRLVALANAAANEIHLLDLATGEVRARLTGHTEHVWQAVFSPDGRTLASTSHDQTTRLWHVATARLLAVLAPDRSTAHVAFSPDGRWLLTGTAASRVIVWQAK